MTTRETLMALVRDEQVRLLRAERDRLSIAHLPCAASQFPCAEPVDFMAIASAAQRTFLANGLAELRRCRL
jgi:hypothetical protein